MNKKIGIVACGLLALSLTGCQKKVDEKVIDEVGPGPVVNPEATENTEIANPIVDYANAEELAAVAGFDIMSYEAVSEPVSQALEGGATVAYQMVSNEIAQVRISYDNGAYAEFRASKTLSGISDLAGVYTSVEGVKTGEEDDAPIEYNVALEDRESTMVVTTYTVDGINFAIVNVGPVKEADNEEVDDIPATEAPEDVVEAE